MQVREHEAGAQPPDSNPQGLQATEGSQLEAAPQDQSSPGSVLLFGSLIGLSTGSGCSACKDAHTSLRLRLKPPASA